MRILVGKIFLALLVGTLLLGPISWASIRAKDHMLADPIFRLPDGTETLIAGDSHAEVGLDPTHLPGSASIATSAENYFYTYFKIRHFLRRNPGIKTVVLGCGWHNFTRGYQESWLFGDKAASKQEYFPLLDNGGTRTLRRWSPDYLVPLLVYDAGLPIGLYKNNFLLKGIVGRQLSRKDIPFYGGYLGLDSSRIEGAEIREKLQLYYACAPPASEVEVSSVMVVFFRKIIELCRANSIRVLLVNTPVHSLYREGVPGKMISEFNRVIAETIAAPGVRYVDLSDLPLPESSFLNGDHVNRRGAGAVTKVVADMLAPGREPSL
jgi:hypothetical protein